jgi:subtilase family serine protease
VLAALKASSFPIRPVSKGVAEFVVNNSTASEWFLGSDYAQAYGAAELFPGAHSVANATYPTSVAIATLLASSYNGTTNTNLPPWDPAVIAAYFNGTLGPGWPNSTFTGVPVTLDNVTPPAPGSFGGRNDSTLFETENSLDLEMAGSMAPGASIYNFYIAASLIANATRLGDVADFFAWDLSAALNYSYSPAHLAVVSCSFGLTDLDNAFWDEELLRAAAMGVTVVAASGDQGNAPNQWSGRSDGQWPVWPATAATNLAGSVSVGGVSIDLAGSPNAFFNGSTLNLSYDSADGAISSVSAWYDTLGGEGQYAGTEGGISTVYSEPLWQFESAAQPAIVNATLTQGADVLGRAGPDVAMPANNTIATVYADTNGTIYFSVLEGTSVAAPVLAGLLADVVAVENNGSSPLWTSLGFLDPEIYQFASYFATHPNATGDPFLDVTQGANWVFSAAPGWDPTTGWGEVNGPLFLAADENSTLHHYVYTGPMPGLPPIVSNPSSSGPVPWPYIFAIFGVGLVLAIVLVALAARPSRPRPPPASVPWGAQGGGPTWGQGPPPPGGYPGATFLCPYCGAIRPAEPVRCPQCGAF